MPWKSTILSTISFPSLSSLSFLSCLPPSLHSLLPCLSCPGYRSSQDPCLVFESLCSKFPHCVPEFLGEVGLQLNTGFMGLLRFLVPLPYVPTGVPTGSLPYELLASNRRQEYCEVCPTFDCPFILHVKQLSKWRQGRQTVGRVLLNQIWVFCSSALKALLLASLWWLKPPHHPFTPKMAGLFFYFFKKTKTNTT